MSSYTTPALLPSDDLFKLDLLPDYDQKHDDLTIGTPFVQKMRRWAMLHNSVDSSLSGIRPLMTHLLCNVAVANPQAMSLADDTSLSKITNVIQGVPHVTFQYRDKGRPVTVPITYRQSAFAVNHNAPQTTVDLLLSATNLTQDKLQNEYQDILHSLRFLQKQKPAVEGFAKNFFYAPNDGERKHMRDALQSMEFVGSVGRLAKIMNEEIQVITRKHQEKSQGKSF